jgi:hypothetical protein
MSRTLNNAKIQQIPSQQSRLQHNFDTHFACKTAQSNNNNLVTLKVGSINSKKYDLHDNRS